MDRLSTSELRLGRKYSCRIRARVVHRSGLQHHSFSTARGNFNDSSRRRSCPKSLLKRRNYNQPTCRRQGIHTYTVANGPTWNLLPKELVVDLSACAPLTHPQGLEAPGFWCHHCRRRPPELGRSPCRALLGFRGLPGGEALPARGEMGLQGWARA